MKTIFGVVTALMLSFCFFVARSQGTSNKGTEFWTAYTDHESGPNGTPASKMVLYITSDISTSGTVEIADGSFSQIFNLIANQVEIIEIPASAFLGHTSSAKGKKGVHITSLKPIAVYAHIYASSVSGATLLFPVNAMGKTYVSLNYIQESNAAAAYSSFAIIGTEDGTTVSITPTAALISGEPAGAAFSITLNKGEVYQGLSSRGTDLTGTKIQSISTAAGICKKIAVFSGSSKIKIGCAPNNAAITSDNLFQQVYPTSAWGKNYVTAPLSSRSYDVYRIVLSDPATTVTLNGTQLATNLFTQGYYEFQSRNTNVIVADKPIQVVQYSVSQGQGFGCSTITGDIGDPEMIYLSPIEQGLDHVTLFSTGYYGIQKSFINVVIPTSAVSSFTLDGVPYNTFSSITGSPYSYAQIPVSSGPRKDNGVGSITSGTHTIKASEPFNAIAYGFGNTESYGYAAGTNLQDLTEFVQFKNPQNSNVQTTGCVGVDYKLQVTVPYKTTKNITWKVDGVLTSQVTTPTQYTTQMQGTKILYTYEFPGLVKYAVGTHIITATVFNPDADDCGNDVEIGYNFDVTSPPVIDFTLPANTCLGDVAVFKDTSTPVGGNVATAWLWDFGDGQTSALQNPSHTYATAGDYIVALTISDNSGCTSTITKTTHVATLPVAGFTVSTPNCAGQSVTFTNTSTSTDDTITTWTWNYGDGTTQVLTNGTPSTHIYTTAGNYNTTLTVTTDKGCTSTVFTTAITINPTPEADFTLPDVCLADAFAQFTDKSTIVNNTAFTYLWNFGDHNANSGNPNTSTLKNPQHKYLQAANYTVTLTITSASGCVSTKSHSFTVNGSTPVAAFTYPASICSSDDVIFTDISTVDFGIITKVIFYYDFGNRPTDAVTYTGASLASDKKYHHTYGLFNTPLSKNYQVKMVVYSGQTCFSEVIHTVTVNANPIITLNPATNLTLCQSDLPVQIAENKNGFVGAGVFTGTGISSTGLFDPKLSGAGTFTINYLFTSNTTGCTYATTLQVTVNPTPVVTATTDLQLLEGGQVTLAATAKVATGTITYKWTPSTGLSSDNELNPIASPTDFTTYTLTVTSDKFCSTVVKVNVNVLKAPIINNTFTPNGDGINDTWVIKYLDSYPKATVSIFNRQGETVYFSNGYPVAWDGRYRGNDLPAGIYYYIINPNSGRKAIAGYISIVR